MIDLAYAIKYPFSGQNVLGKTFVGALMFLLAPITLLPGLVLLGYQLRVIRNVFDEVEGLPEWDNIGEDFWQGIVVFLGSLLYYLPAFVLTALGARMLWSILVRWSTSLDPFHKTSVTVSQADLSMICLLFLLALAWLVFSAPLMMASVARYAETGDFSSFLKILVIADEVWEQRKAAGLLMLNLFILALITQVVSMVLSFTCFMGIYIQFIQFAAFCHLAGQWGKILKENRPPPSVIRPIQPPPWR